MLERTLRLAGNHADEVLVVGIASDLFNELTDTKLLSLLYDARAEHLPSAQSQPTAL